MGQWTLRDGCDASGDASRENLKQLTAGRNDVFVYQGDSNEVLIRDVFPQVRYDQYKRGLCLPIRMGSRSTGR